MVLELHGVAWAMGGVAMGVGNVVLRVGGAVLGDRCGVRCWWAGVKRERHIAGSGWFGVGSCWRGVRYGQCEVESGRSVLDGCGLALGSGGAVWRVGTVASG